MEGEETRILRGRPEPVEVERILSEIYAALEEKGYDPVRQLAYFLITGEPAYITAHRNARVLAASLPRDGVVEELLRHYLKNRGARGA
jgi:uncharacterized protein (UPF0297 family)